MSPAKSKSQLPPKKKILIVEDDLDILESLEITLRMKQYEVSTTSDTPGVCSLVEKIKPDLIIMDVMMPPPDGIELCRKLKSNMKTKKIPLLLLSARTQPAAVESGFHAGADRYLSKPFLNEDLLRSLDSLLQKHPLTEKRS